MMQKLHKCPFNLNEFEREWTKNFTFMLGLKIGSLVLSLIGLYPMGTQELSLTQFRSLSH